MPVNNRIAALAPEMTAWRRELHQHPQICYEETYASDFVAAKLAEWGIEVHRGLGITGVVGVLRGQPGAGRIGLRADMDALPMQEATDLPYASRNPGRMHACGHDGHTATLLGAAKYLAETRNFAGTVHFVFQPAEEGGAGAAAMMRDGLFERFPCDAIYGVHNAPELPLGMAATIPGPLLAASDRVRILVKGYGGHASKPHLAVDPVLVGAHVLVALQSLVSRRTDPLDSAVVSLCQFHGGSADNVIAAEAVLTGTVRTLKAATRDAMERGIAQIAEATALAHGATAEVTYERMYPPTVNHAAETALAVRAAARVLGEGAVLTDIPPLMGGEDFSFYLQERPGNFLFLGGGATGRENAPLHHPRYDFNDDLLAIGASYFSALVEQELPR
jgi:hippurate hydrolase